MAIKFVEMIVAQPPTHIKVSSVQEPCAKSWNLANHIKKTLQSASIYWWKTEN